MPLYTIELTEPRIVHAREMMLCHAPLTEYQKNVITQRTAFTIQRIRSLLGTDNCALFMHRTSTTLVADLSPEQRDRIVSQLPITAVMIDQPALTYVQEKGALLPVDQLGSSLDAS